MTWLYFALLVGAVWVVLALVASGLWAWWRNRREHLDPGIVAEWKRRQIRHRRAVRELEPLTPVIPEPPDARRGYP